MENHGRPWRRPSTKCGRPYLRLSVMFSALALTSLPYVTLFIKSQQCCFRWRLFAIFLAALAAACDCLYQTELNYAQPFRKCRQKRFVPHKAHHTAHRRHEVIPQFAQDSWCRVGQLGHGSEATSLVGQQVHASIIQDQCCVEDQRCYAYPSLGVKDQHAQHSCAQEKPSHGVAYSPS